MNNDKFAIDTRNLNRMSESENRLPQEFKILEESKTKLTYYKGETIFKQDAFAPYVIYIIEGLVKISLHTGPGKQINLRLAGKGDFLALSAIFGENKYLTSAIAIKDTITCMIDKDSLGRLLQDNPEHALQLSIQNHEQESRLISLVRSLSYNQMRGKLAAALLYLSAGKFLKEDVFAYLTRQDLADFAGISLESTVKFLKEFEREGIVSLEGKLVTILDNEKLVSLSLHS